ncbi:hypothetical protein Acr_00g0004390 [Actinidia rufa]|uniref:Uncharacterized protein n=1 Tax=Actinidia rufa TaxID=165716 RepID=A0A7J0D7F0_9ERIC|nr:hypothetical protein Acr_00g0003410 [Actinidia rufa]GFS28704.1 hypothetical protein Acr_00g0003420 [Actinidia rufa]GFS28870.1 hypothetical protein Acr_00g0004380 [Actinidia rufa]GFS28872.1 hypothetical protein Acr_00g0004390 [Actinidia rufa]
MEQGSELPDMRASAQPSQDNERVSLCPLYRKKPEWETSQKNPFARLICSLLALALALVGSCALKFAGLVGFMSGPS